MINMLHIVTMTHNVLITSLSILLALGGPAAANTDCPNELAGIQSAIWPRPDIQVCWENGDASDARERSLVQQAVGETWERYSAVHFVGWGPCQQDDPGIHIQISDTGPHTKGLGNKLDGRQAGMVLNFAFNNWSLECKSTKDKCIKAISVHEFGHALGFTHEQNRPDAPPQCRLEEAQGQDPDTMITPYDLHSVMNYCNPHWSGDGKLSEQDINGLQLWYGLPKQPASRYDGEWEVELHYSDQTCVNDKVRVNVQDSLVTGAFETPYGARVPISGRIDADSALQGMVFRLNAADTLTLMGRFPDGRVRSTDCGCGQYRFKRVQ